MQAFVKRMGKKAGRKAWLGFRSKNDPEAPTTVSKRFPYETRSAFAKRGLALPDPDSVRFTRPRSASTLRRAGSGLATRRRIACRRRCEARRPRLQLGAGLRQGVGDRPPDRGDGPAGRLLRPADPDGGGPARARASTPAAPPSPGVNLYVQLGHGRDYAWSATTATSDNVDTFAEVLCKDDFHYRYRGKCLAMEKLEKSESWTPNAIDSTPAGLADADRLPHRARDRLRPRQGAAARRSPSSASAAPTSTRPTRWSASRQLNEPGVVTGPAGLQEGRLQHQLPLQLVLHRLRAHRLRALGLRCRSGRRAPRPTSRSSAPASTTGRATSPATQHGRLAAVRQAPAGGRPAPSSSPGTTSRRRAGRRPTTSTAYGPLFRSQMIADKVKAATKGKKKMTIAQLVQAMEEPATQDLRGYRLLPIDLQGDRQAEAERRCGGARDAADLARGAAPTAATSNRDGVYEENAAVELMDAWWPKLVDGRVQAGARRQGAIEQLEGMLRDSATTPAARPTRTGLLRRLVGLRLQGPARPLRPEAEGRLEPRLLRRAARRRSAAAMLAATLRAALKVTPQQLYGGGDGACAAEPAARPASTRTGRR